MDYTMETYKSTAKALTRRSGEVDDCSRFDRAVTALNLWVTASINDDVRQFTNCLMPP